MFTGIIEEIGEVVAIEVQQAAAAAAVTDSNDPPAAHQIPETLADTPSLRLTVRGPLVTSDAALGDSIQVSGVCLTVVALGDAPDVDGSAADAIGSTDGTFTVDVMAQTVQRSTLGSVRVRDRVNLERAVRVGDRLGGHLVQGHVDGTAELLAAREQQHPSGSLLWRVLRFRLAAQLAPLLVATGSVTLSGVSLTVSDISAAADPEPWFEVSLIPETLTATTLGQLRIGDRVNLETDMIARHLARMQHFGAALSGLQLPEPPKLTAAAETVTSSPASDRTPTKTTGATGGTV